MADPRYLHESVSTIDYERFVRDASPNVAREGLTYGYSDDYEQFWSLGFVIAKATFEELGGFDETFTGYGAEDTDFAFTAHARGVRMYYSRAKVFHQPHPEYDPPLNWLKDIVANAQRFKHKWSVWPMQGWLDAFEASGYIARSRNAIKILRLPTDEEITRAMR